MDKTKKETTTIKSINPTTGNVLKEYEIMADAQVDAKINKAHETFKEWKKTSFSDRAGLLKKVARLMIEKKNDLGKLCSQEMGKVYAQGVGEVMVCAAIFNYYAENGEKFMTDAPVDTPVGRAFVAYEPIGVLLSIQPWNFPFYQVSRSSAPHIMAGNTYVLKHSSNVPQCAAAMEDLFREAGAPEGLFTNLFISGSKASEFISHKYIRGITFTGSESVGTMIASEAGKLVKKTVLELGGSDPLLVLKGAAIDVAVTAAAMGRLANAGQVCTSPKRIIVHESIADEFIRKAKAMYEQVKIGDPLNPQTVLGPVVTEEALEQILKQVNDTVKAGAKLVYGGERITGAGAFMQPTILTDIKPGMVAYSEEIFGPVLCIYVVKDEQEAIDLANDTRFGLGASIFSHDEQNAVKVARQIDSGMVFINHVTSSMPELIFGGTKDSGYGRELSREGMLEFVNHKLIRTSSPDAQY